MHSSLHGPLNHPSLLCLLFVGTSAVFTATTYGQAGITAFRPAEIAVTGSFTSAAPGYGAGPNTGFAGGAEASPTIRLPVRPSLVFRTSYISGPSSTERTLETGLHLQTRLFHLHPFAELLIGEGRIDYAHPDATPTGLYAHDRGIVEQLGAGVDVPVARRLSARLEYDEQRWNLGGRPPVIFHPHAFSAGVRYVLPFRSAASR